MSKPDLLLMDEPFSNIDQSLKGYNQRLQSNIKKMLKKLEITTIMSNTKFGVKKPILTKLFIWVINVVLF